MRKFCVGIVLCLATLMAAAQNDMKQQLLKADRDFCQATQEKRLEGWMQYMADDGVVERGRPVVGKDAVRAELKAEWDNPNFHLKWDPDEAYAMPGGKMGYTRGHWELGLLDKAGNPLKMTGEYLTIWRMDQQGQWKIIWDGGSSNPAKKQ